MNIALKLLIKVLLPRTSHSQNQKFSMPHQRPSHAAILRSGRQAPRVCRTRQPRARADGRETLSQRYDEHNDTFRSYHPLPPFVPSFLPSASTARRGLAAMPFLRQAHFLQWGIAGKWPNHRFRATHSFCTPDSYDQAMECI